MRKFYRGSVLSALIKFGTVTTDPTLLDETPVNCIVGALAVGMIGGIIYWCIKKINRPISSKERKKLQ